jgi:hypothetical protein
VERATLLRSIDRIAPELKQAIGRFEMQVSQELPFLACVSIRTNHRSLVDALLNWIKKNSHDEPKEEEVEQLRQHAILKSRELANRIEPTLIEGIEPTIDDFVAAALQLSRKEKLDGLQSVLEWFHRLRLIVRASEPDAEINVLRQGFILLMTAFDAAVFDLVRVKLRKNFFDLIGAFGKNEKVTLQEIGAAGSFEVFRDKLIEEQLKARYIKDLLCLLRDMGVPCTDEDAGDRFIQLIELVLRRNVHVHNRGVVDERYLERDQKGSPKYNLYNLSLGEVARIDEPYWEMANRLCSLCVIRVADWAGN